MPLEKVSVGDEQKQYLGDVTRVHALNTPQMCEQKTYLYVYTYFSKTTLYRMHNTWYINMYAYQ